MKKGNLDPFIDDPAVNRFLFMKNTITTENTRNLNIFVLGVAGGPPTHLFQT